MEQATERRRGRSVTFDELQDGLARAARTETEHAAAKLRELDAAIQRNEVSHASRCRCSNGLCEVHVLPVLVQTLIAERDAAVNKV